MERLPDLRTALDAFFIDLTLEGRSPATVKTYKALLKLDGDLLSLTPESCRQMIAHRMGTQSRATARTFAGALASFCNYITRYGIPDPMKEVPSPRPIQKPHSYLSREEIQALYHACPNDSYKLMLLLLLEGLRASEACGLKHTDISGDVASITGKGSKPRKIAVSVELRALLEGGSGPVLGYSTSRLRARLLKLARWAGIKRRVHPHLLRHSWATHALLAGGETQALMTLGGWSNPQMLNHYTRSAMQEAALSKSREMNLTEKLLDTASG